MKTIHFSFVSLMALMLIGCAPKLIVVTENEVTNYESNKATLLDAVGEDGLGKLMQVYALLRCYKGETCPGIDYSIIINYWGKHTYMDGKKIDVISDGQIIPLREDHNYYTTFVNHEWFEEQWFPYNKEQFSKVANAKKVEIKIGDKKYEIRQKDRILWKKLIDPLAPEK
ncbi:MAG: hypothetical protein H8E38_02670 [SAR324 cluster bacterium]|nr:hypothetical protein [SAR324 cluster bacterium]